MKYFGKKQAVQDNRHYQFKITASAAILQFESTNLHQARQLNVSFEQALHSLEKVPYFKHCFYCQYGFVVSQKKGNTATVKCTACNAPICKPTKAPCWDLHIIKGLPKNNTTSEKEVARCREIILKRKKTLDAVNWHRKTFSFQWNRGTALVQNISFCWQINTQKHWIFSTFLLHEKMTNMIIAYPNIARPKNLCYLT